MHDPLMRLFGLNHRRRVFFDVMFFLHDFWLVIMICLRYSYVFLWFLVGLHGFSRYFHVFVFSTLSLSTVCNDKQKNVNCHQLTILFRLPGCFNVNSALAFFILSLPIIYKDKTINSDCLNVQASRMLQCQQCSCFFHTFTSYRLQG